MATTKRDPHRDRALRPALTADAQEGQMVAMAVDLVARQIQDGTVSSQVLAHYLKLGSSREKLEQARLKKENELLLAKVDQLSSAKNVEELYSQALAAMREYQGQVPEEEELE